MSQTTITILLMNNLIAKKRAFSSKSLKEQGIEGIEKSLQGRGEESKEEIKAEDGKRVWGKRRWRKRLRRGPKGSAVTIEY